MNARQVAFYRQARSDWSIFRHFHPRGLRWWTAVRRAWCSVAGVWAFSFPPCHELHYLPGRPLVDDRFAHGLKQESPSKSHGVSSGVSQPNKPRISLQFRRKPAGRHQGLGRR